MERLVRGTQGLVGWVRTWLTAAGNGFGSEAGA